MARLPGEIEGRRFLRALDRLGWRVESQKGSHRKLVHPDRRDFIIVAFHRTVGRETRFVGSFVTPTSTRRRSSRRFEGHATLIRLSSSMGSSTTVERVPLDYGRGLTAVTWPPLAVHTRPTALTHSLLRHLTNSGWNRTVNVRYLSRSGKEFVLQAELPGVAKEDLDIEVTEDGVEFKAEAKLEEGVLTLRARKKEASTESEGRKVPVK